MEKSSKYCTTPDVKRIEVEIEKRKDVKEHFDEKKYLNKVKKNQTGIQKSLLNKGSLNKLQN